MIWTAAFLLALIPHVGNPWALSALIFVAIILIAFHFKLLLSQVLTQLGANQQKIYKKIS